MTGSVPARELGATLMHEHLFVLTPEIQSNYDTGYRPDEQVAEAVRLLDEVAERGIDTLVDVSVVGLGRDVELVRRVAEATRVNIVAATGLYTYDTLPHWFDHRRGAGGREDPMVDLFVGDIVEGLAGTELRAGVLKCATDRPGVTEGVERVLRAVARAHRRTGVPITTHTHAATRRGLEQQRIFEEEGVDLSRVVIGHSGDSDDLDYLEELLAAGSYLGMDRFGLDMVLPFESRVDVVAELCRRGRADRLVLSHDAACYIDWMPAGVEAVVPNWRFTHIPDDVLPALRERGVTAEQIDQMMVVNPRTILDHAGPY